MLTYYPIQKNPQTGAFLTDDRGYLDPDGYLHIIGRTSDKIITGGENIYPSEVEALIRATGLVQDICVVGLPDEVWGEQIIAIYVRNSVDSQNPHFSEIEFSEIEFSEVQLIPKNLWQGSPQQYPKHWVEVPALPRNNQGKIDRPQLLQTLQRLQNPKSFN